MKIRFLAIGLVIAASAGACLNDRDTLADEAKQNRDVLTTLVGGFERNPPLYYQMRIDRIKRDLSKNPKLLDEYDDIAVAYDRIGHDDEAIKWIEKKKAHMEPYWSMSTHPGDPDQWYRYYANCGTFWVHRWARNGADSKKIDQVKHGRDLIDQALRINPNAHFGREKYQRVVMSWLIDSREEEPISLSRYIASSIHGDDKKNAITGLTGLIRLGGAWQSTDVYLAIASLYYYPEQSMAGIAKLRAKEIYDNGGKSMDPGFKDFESESSDVLDHPSLDEHEISEFKRLRDIADKWNADREAFMLRKLEKGDHPDTDPHFWDGSPTLPPLTVHQSVGSWFRHDVLTMEHEAWFGLAVCFGSTILIVYAVVRARRNYNQRIGKGPIQN